MNEQDQLVDDEDDQLELQLALTRFESSTYMGFHYLYVYLEIPFHSDHDDQK